MRSISNTSVNALIIGSMLTASLAYSVESKGFTEAEGYAAGSLDQHPNWDVLFQSDAFQVDPTQGLIELGNKPGTAVYVKEPVNFNGQARVTQLDFQFRQTETMAPKQTKFAALSYLRDSKFGSVKSADMGIGRTGKPNGYRFVGFGNTSEVINASSLGIANNGDTSDVIRVWYLLAKGERADNWTAAYVVTNLDTTNIVASGTRETLNVGEQAHADNDWFGAISMGKELYGVDTLKILNYDSYYVKIPESSSTPIFLILACLGSTVLTRRKKTHTNQLRT